MRISTQQILLVTSVVYSGSLILRRESRQSSLNVEAELMVSVPDL